MAYKNILKTGIVRIYYLELLITIYSIKVIQKYNKKTKLLVRIIRSIKITIFMNIIVLLLLLSTS